MDVTCDIHVTCEGARPSKTVNGHDMAATWEGARPRDTLYMDMTCDTDGKRCQVMKY